MKAIVQEGYGSPDVLRLEDVETPTVGDDGVLVKIHAASVNALDWHITRGMPYLVRLAAGRKTPRERDKIRGVDLAGQVVAVGKNVTRFKPGDDVFGAADGSFAEYAATAEKHLAAMPSGVTYEQAATLNVAGLTALQGLRDKAQVKAGQRVLVNGAGGGVGTFAVQIAKWLGAHVTAVTRTENVDTIRSIGADQVIDYRVEDFAGRGEHYDVFLDIGGNRPLAECQRVLSRGGVFVSVGGTPGRWLAPATRLLKVALWSLFTRRQRLVAFIAKNDHADLTTLVELIRDGKISPVIDRRYALSETPEAIRYVGEGNARGKVVIQVG